MPAITQEHVNAAYTALASGDADKIDQYWAEDMVWLVPGHNQVSGWKNSRAEFLAFMQKVGQLSDNSFNMSPVTITTNEEYSTDVTHNTGHRAGEPDRVLNIEVGHTLRWRDGKVIEGKGGIFGDGTAQYDEFWA